jgi:hypothetical protein
MAKSKLRGGKKAHNKRVQTRNKKIKENEVVIESLKKKIFEEAKLRYEQEQSKRAEIKIAQ